MTTIDFGILQEQVSKYHRDVIVRNISTRKERIDFKISSESMRSTCHGEPMAQRLGGGASARYRVIPLDSFHR